MDVRTVSLFLALLAVLAQVAIVAYLPARRAFRRVVGPHALGLAFAVATVATLGSLYFSEGAHFPPCRLCWYQRICMYPLVPMLGIAAFRRDRAVRPYAAALAGVGAVVATSHVLVERFPRLEGSGCDPTNPCTLTSVRQLGYLTIPAMALTAFLLILVLLHAEGDHA